MCLGHQCGVTLTGAGQQVIIRPATSHLTHSHTHTYTHIHKHTHGHMCNTICLLEDVGLHSHTHAHILYSHAFSLFLSHTRTATPSLLLCEKPQSLNEPQICPVNWCSHARRHQYSKTHSYKYTHTHKCHSDSTFTPFPRRKKTPTSHPFSPFSPASKYSMCVKESHLCVFSEIQHVKTNMHLHYMCQL